LLDSSRRNGGRDVHEIMGAARGLAWRKGTIRQLTRPAEWRQLQARDGCNRLDPAYRFNAVAYVIKVLGQQVASKAAKQDRKIIQLKGDRLQV
jgi:hypothetical protein